LSRKDHRDIVEIEVYDQTYPLRLATSAEREDVLKLAEEVDLRMREIAKQTGTVDSLKVAILTALHLAQDARDKQAVPDTRLENAVRRGSMKWIAAIDELL
jgi:cell division protein ZapA (FtsZ GTPase activity inhibitor)